MVDELIENFTDVKKLLATQAQKELPPGVLRDEKVDLAHDHVRKTLEAHYNDTQATGFTYHQKPLSDGEIKGLLRDHVQHVRKNPNETWAPNNTTLQDALNAKMDKRLKPSTPAPAPATSAPDRLYPDAAYDTAKNSTPVDPKAAANRADRKTKLIGNQEERVKKVTADRAELLKQGKALPELTPQQLADRKMVISRQTSNAEVGTAFGQLQEAKIDKTLPVERTKSARNLPLKKAPNTSNTITAATHPAPHGTPRPPAPHAPKGSGRLAKAAAGAKKWGIRGGIATGVLGLGAIGAAWWGASTLVNAGEKAMTSAVKGDPRDQVDVMPERASRGFANDGEEGTYFQDNERARRTGQPRQRDFNPRINSADAQDLDPNRG